MEVLEVTRTGRYIEERTGEWVHVYAGNREDGGCLVDSNYMVMDEAVERAANLDVTDTLEYTDDGWEVQKGSKVYDALVAIDKRLEEYSVLDESDLEFRIVDGMGESIQEHGQYLIGMQDRTALTPKDWDRQVITFLGAKNSDDVDEFGRYKDDDIKEAMQELGLIV